MIVGIIKPLQVINFWFLPRWEKSVQINFVPAEWDKIIPIKYSIKKNNRKCLKYLSVIKDATNDNGHKFVISMTLSFWCRSNISNNANFGIYQMDEFANPFFEDISPNKYGITHPINQCECKKNILEQEHYAVWK